MKVISQDLMDLDIALKDKAAVIEWIADKMVASNRTDKPLGLIEDIYHREAEASTSMGFGVAIPHAQSSAVTIASVVFLRLKSGIEWNEDEGVRLIFGICVPQENVDNTHLKLLSKIARKLVNETFREELLTVKTLEECERLLASIN